MTRTVHLIRKYIYYWRKIPSAERPGLWHGIKVGVKYYPAWKRGLRDSAAALADHAPWITFESRGFVETILKPWFTVFEYGSGGSTLFYARRVKKVVAVEHDSHWHASVMKALAAAGINNCKCLVVPPEPINGLPGDPADPAAYCSKRDLYQHQSFRGYATSIDEFPDEYFDFISVDGRARPSCISHAYLKVKVGGYLLLDNSERHHYHRAREIISDWEEHDFYGPGPYGFPFWKTTVWRRTRI